MHWSSVIVFFVVVFSAVAVPFNGAAHAKFLNQARNEQHQCPVNINRLMALMCKGPKITNEFCEARVPFIVEMTTKYQTEDPFAILDGQCCAARRCRLSTMRALCCMIEEQQYMS